MEAIYVITSLFLNCRTDFGFLVILCVGSTDFQPKRCLGELRAQTKQNQLINKSADDEQKRLFIEAILSLLTTGVIALDKNFNINLINDSALLIFKKQKEDLIKKNILIYFPEWEEWIIDFSKSNIDIDQKQIEYYINDNIRNLHLKIIKEIKDNIITGFLVTIDDMTSLILAEKHAAWSDIARKIAHEVKNPLTPIKLSAERIERKYKEKDFNNEELSKLTKTISKQVDDIGKLVDEFSSFARMPKPEMKQDDFNETITESYNLFKNAHTNINFKINSYNKNIFFQFDKFQLTQAFNNLIKNAVEAVDNIPNPSINIVYYINNYKLFIEFIDNGIGVDNAKITKFFEPYYTTKAKGTGLGLSIVKKIIEDHKGVIKIEKNSEQTGSKITLIFNIE